MIRHISTAQGGDEKVAGALLQPQSEEVGRNSMVVSPDGGCNNFCYLFDSLTYICGNSQTIISPQETPVDAVVVENDDGDDCDEEVLASATEKDSFSDVCYSDEGLNYQLQHQPQDVTETDLVDPMDVNSYITACLKKPIGIQFGENSSEYGGVFVADITKGCSAAADGSIRRGYQLIAVGEKRVSGMDFDEAVMKHIVDKADAEVMLVFFTGLAERLYDPSAGVTEEWLDYFVAINAKKMNSRIVDIKDNESAIEVMANATTDVASEDDVTDEVVEGSSEEEDAQYGGVEHAEPTDDSIGGSDFNDERNYDFFAKLTDLNNTKLTSPIGDSPNHFHWTPKNNNSLPDDIEETIDHVEENTPKEDFIDADKDDDDEHRTHSWCPTECLTIESSQDDTLEATSSPTLAEDASEASAVSNVDVVNVAASNDVNDTIKIKGTRDVDDVEETDDEPANPIAQSCDGAAAFVETKGNLTSSLSDLELFISGSKQWPHSDASYSPSTGLILRKYGEPPEISSEDEVLIKVEATTLSTRDCLEKLRRDNNKKLKNEFWVPGHEIVGRVVRAGERAKIFLNRRVAALLPFGGGCCRYVCIHAKNLISLPEQAVHHEIVALLSTYMPAYQCLEYAKNNYPDTIAPTLNKVVSEENTEAGECHSTVDNVKQKKDILVGKNVLINGAGSPVGLALIDVARNAGASVYAVSHSTYESVVREMDIEGWYPLFKKNEWTKSWRGKMDIIVDTVGDYNNYTSFYDVMASGGRFVRINTTSCEEKYVPVLSGEKEKDKIFSVLNDYKGSRINKKAIDYEIFHCFNEDQELFTEDLAYLHHLLEIGKIDPKVFSQVGFNELEEEWMKVMLGGVDGVVVVSPWKN